MATEFPIYASCDVPELKAECTVPDSMESIPTKLELANVDACVHFYQDFSEVSPDLRGFIRESFLIDESGLPNLENSLLKWKGVAEGPYKKWQLLSSNDDVLVEQSRPDDIPVLVDGILIAGPPGRYSYKNEVERYLGHTSSGIYSVSPVLLDTRGGMKPEITTARTTPRVGFRRSFPGWERLTDAFHCGTGLLWAKLADYLVEGMTPEVFWKLLVMHEVSASWLPADVLFSTVPVSLTRDVNESVWYFPKDLTGLSFHQDCESDFHIRDSLGRVVGPNDNLRAWEESGKDHPSLKWEMSKMILLISGLDIQDGQVSLHQMPLSKQGRSIIPYISTSDVGVRHLLTEYVGQTNEALSIETPFPTANRSHPLVRIKLASRYITELNDLQLFAKSFISLIAESLSSRPQTVEFEQPGYWHKRVGHLYFDVRWDEYDDSLKPPYKLWTKSKGWILFGEDDFDKWRQLPVQP